MLAFAAAAFAAAVLFVGAAFLTGNMEKMQPERKLMLVFLLSVVCFLVPPLVPDLKPANSDLLAEWLPALLTGLIIGFLMFRLQVSSSLGQDVLPPGTTVGPVPAAVFALVGTLTVQDIYESAMERPGGVQAFIPLVMLAAVSGAIAYCGQAAASTGKLSLPLLGTAVAVGASYYVMIDGADDGAQGGKKAGSAAKKAVTDMVESDFVQQNLPLILGGLILFTLAARLLSKRRAVPPSLCEGAFPASLFVVLGSLSFNAIYKKGAYSNGQSFDDLLPLIGISVASGCVASVGARLSSS